MPPATQDIFASVSLKWGNEGGTIKCKSFVGKVIVVVIAAKDQESEWSEGMFL